MSSSIIDVWIVIDKIVIVFSTWSNDSSWGRCPRDFENCLWHGIEPEWKHFPAARVCYLLRFLERLLQGLLIFPNLLNMPAENHNFDLYSLVLILLAAAPWTITFVRCLNCKKSSCSSSSKPLGHGGKEGREGESPYIASTVLNWAELKQKPLTFFPCSCRCYFAIE